MDPEHKALLLKIIALLESIDGNTDDIHYVKQAVENVEAAVKTRGSSEERD